jgi:predicted RNase H-like HicB family nuclease
MEIVEYLIVVEGDDSGGYSAFVPDLPVVVIAAKTREAIAREARDAIAFHIEGLRESGRPVPPPTSFAMTAPVA